MVSEAIQRLIPEMFRFSAALEAAAPGRSFTPDGHMVGSIGEALAAVRFGLTLAPASTEGIDAHDPQGRPVEIKATGGNKGVNLRGFEAKAEFVVVLQIHRDGGFTVIHNGPAAPAWECVAHKQMPSNGQRAISLNQLRKLQANVRPEQMLPEVEP